MERPREEGKKEGVGREPVALGGDRTWIVLLPPGALSVFDFLGSFLHKMMLCV